MGVPLALALSLAASVALMVGGVALVQVWPERAWLMPVLALFETILYVGCAFGIARVFTRGDLREGLALRGVSLGELAFAAFLGPALHLTAGFIDALVELRFPTPPQQLAQQLAALTPHSELHAAALLAGVALLAPFAEEVFFRGALFSALERSSPARVAAWATSIAFTLAHQEARRWAPLLLVAWVMGELRRKSASLWPGLALHVAFNATTLLAVFVTRPVRPEPPVLHVPGALLGTVLVIAGLYAFSRAASARRSKELAH
jgi:membrane protease YdiL (CAAX protease family)